MASSTIAAVCILCLALAASQPAAADTISCVALRDYYSPYHTYSTVEARTDGACCRLCAQDDRCVAWSLYPEQNLCALKNDTDIFVQVTGVLSGVKYSGSDRPDLSNNDVDAYVLLGIAGPSGGRRGGPVTASASATSSGGSTTAFVTASNDGVTTSSSVSGTGRARTSATTPSVSLATSLSADDTDGPASLSVVYFDQPSIRAELPTTLRKNVAVVGDSSNEPTCLFCPQFRCVFTRGLHFKRGGEILVDTTTRNIRACCNLCRNNPSCRSWWRNPDTNRCVLQSNIPAAGYNPKFAGGTYV